MLGHGTKYYQKISFILFFSGFVGSNEQQKKGDGKREREKKQINSVRQELYDEGSPGRQSAVSQPQSFQNLQVR